MRDFRFHVATLIAIFLALGLGIFIGHAIPLELQMGILKSQIADVQKESAGVSDENKRLHSDNQDLIEMQKHLQNEMSQFADLGIAGRLSGRTVSLVSVGPPPRSVLVERIWSAMGAAGAQRLNEVIIRGPLLPTDPADRSEMLTRVSPGRDGMDPDEMMADAIAHTVGAGTDPLLPPALTHRGVPLDFSGDFGQRPDIVVLLSRMDGPDRLDALEKGDTPETALVKAFQSMGIRVVECEPATEEESGSSYFRRMGLSCVDNVDTTEGRVALVWAALGYSGHFGQKPGADSLLPQVKL